MSDDDTWACEVALCMANPDGPMAVAECVKPIEKLYKHLAKGETDDPVFSRGTLILELLERLPPAERAHYLANSGYPRST